MYNFSGSPYWAYYREGKLAFSKSHTVKQICFFCVHRSDFNMTMCSKVSGLIGKRASWSSYHNTKAMRVRSKVYHVGRIDITWRICQVTSQPDEVTSESRKKIPSAVVIHYCAWYLFSRLRRYISYLGNRLGGVGASDLINIGRKHHLSLKWSTPVILHDTSKDHQILCIPLQPCQQVSKSNF